MAPLGVRGLVYVPQAKVDAPGSTDQRDGFDAHQIQVLVGHPTAWAASDSRVSNVALPMSVRHNERRSWGEESLIDKPTADNLDALPV